MKRTALVCSLILAMAIAVTAAAPGGQRGKTVPRDISGSMSGAFSFVWVGPGDWDFTTEGDAAGTLTHLGLAQLITSHTPDTVGGTLSDGTFTIVAANGDEIRGIYAGSGSGEYPNPVQGTAVFFVRGGSGRFARATGTLNADFLEVFSADGWSAQVEWFLEGTVHY